MPGIVLRVVSKQSYTAPGFSGSTQTVYIVVARAINIAQWREGTLEVRVHENSSLSSTANLYACAEAPTEEDPGQDFVLGFAPPYTSAPSNPMATVAISSATAGGLFYAPLNHPSLTTTYSNLGGFVRLVLGIPVPSAGTNTLVISVDLSLKS